MAMTRTARIRAGYRLLFLLAFLAITLSIGFLHTETGPLGRQDCLACHFLTSSLSTPPAVALVQPVLRCQGTLPLVEPLRSIEVFVLSLCSRSPPSA